MKIEIKKVRIPDTKSEETVEVCSVKIPKDLLAALAEGAEQTLADKVKNIQALPLTDETRRQADLVREFAWTLGRLKTALRVAS